jgi:hypothetical protein
LDPVTVALDSLVKEVREMMAEAAEVLFEATMQDSSIGIAYMRGRKRASVFMRVGDDGMTVLATASGKLETMVLVRLLEELYRSTPASEGE